MPSDEIVDRRIWWLKVSKTADRSNRMRTDDLESAFAIHRASVTESSTVSDECPRLNPDWLASSRLCFDRNEDNWLRITIHHVHALPAWQDHTILCCFRVKSCFGEVKTWFFEYNSLILPHTMFNMAPHGKELSEDLRIRIVALHKDGLRYKKFSNSLEMSYNTMARVIQRFSKTGFTRNRPRKGLSKMLRACAVRQM